MPSLKSYSYSSAEGDWKNFRFRKILSEDHESVFRHVEETFLRDEPTCKLIGFTKDFAEDFHKLLAEMLKDDMSFLAEDKETGEIAGVRITFNHTKDYVFDIPMKSDGFKTLLKLIDEAETMGKVHETMGIDSWAEFFVASTSPKYRNQGLAGEFYKRSIAFLKENGFKHAVVLVSSPYTRAATVKQGFIELSRLDYHTFKGLDGKLAFKSEELEPEHFICFKVKIIE